MGNIEGGGDRMKPTDKELEALIIEGGIYDCIADPYDALDNGDAQSSLMPDLVRLCRAC